MEARLAAILLAAGKSRRMGVCKQLLPLAGKPALVHCIETLVAVGLRDIIVVTGANADEVEATIRHLPVTMVRNQAVDEDMAGSVRVGLGALHGDNSGVMICLADQPLVARETCQQLLRQHAVTPDDILIPLFTGSKGHPTVFPLSLLEQLRHGGTLRDLIRSYPLRVRLLEVDDKWVTCDMDTPDDYQMMREFCEYGRTDFIGTIT